MFLITCECSLYLGIALSASPTVSPNDFSACDLPIVPHGSSFPPGISTTVPVAEWLTATCYPPSLFPGSLSQYSVQCLASGWADSFPANCLMPCDLSVLPRGAVLVAPVPAYALSGDAVPMRCVSPLNSVFGHTGNVAQSVRCLVTGHWAEDACAYPIPPARWSATPYVLLSVFVPLVVCGSLALLGWWLWRRIHPSPTRPHRARWFAPAPRAPAPPCPCGPAPAWGSPPRRQPSQTSLVMPISPPPPPSPPSPCPLLPPDSPPTPAPLSPVVRLARPPTTTATTMAMSVCQSTVSIAFAPHP